MTARQLADRVGCTVSHLHHVLEKDYEATFAAFVNERRVGHAAMLLSEVDAGAVDVEQIGAMSGFRESDQFEEAFQAFFGVSPEEYSRRIDLQPDSLAQTGQFQSVPVTKK